MEFYGAWQEVAMRHRTSYLKPNFGHFYKISDKSQNVHIADLGYLGFQDYHKKFSARSVASKLREATPPVTSMQPLYSALLTMSYCTLHTKDYLCVLTCRFCSSRKVGTGGGGWGHQQGAVHMAAARLGCKRAMVGTGWANSHPRLHEHA